MRPTEFPVDHPASDEPEARAAAIQLLDISQKERRQCILHARIMDYLSHWG